MLHVSLSMFFLFPSSQLLPKCAKQCVFTAKRCSTFPNSRLIHRDPLGHWIFRGGYMKEFLKYISLARLEQFGLQMHVWHPRYDEIRAVKQIWAYHPHIGAPTSHFQQSTWLKIIIQYQTYYVNHPLGGSEFWDIDIRLMTLWCRIHPPPLGDLLSVGWAGPEAATWRNEHSRISDFYTLQKAERTAEAMAHLVMFCLCCLW